VDYSLILTIPANTPLTAPVATRARVPRGVITEIRLDFPSGCAGFAYVRLFALDKQIYPSNLGAYYRGDGIVYLISDHYPLTEYVQEVRLEGYNLDDTYPHTVTLGLTVAPTEARKSATGMLEQLKQTFGLS